MNSSALGPRSLARLRADRREPGTGRKPASLGTSLSTSHGRRARRALATGGHTGALASFAGPLST